MGREPEAGRHGTVRRYKTCRAGRGEVPCPECREAWAAYIREWRAARRRTGGGVIDVVDDVTGEVIGVQHPLF